MTSIIESRDGSTTYHATQQGLVNARMRLDVDDQAASLAGVHEDISAQFHTLQARWLGALDGCQRTVTAYETEVKYIGDCKMNRDGIVRAAGLQCDTSILTGQYTDAPSSSTQGPGSVGSSSLTAPHQLQRAVREAAVAGAIAPLVELNDRMTLLSRRDDIIDAVKKIADALLPAGRLALPDPDAEAPKTANNISNSASQQSSQDDVVAASASLPRLPRHGIEDLVRHTHEILHGDPLALVRAQLTKSLSELVAQESQVDLSMEERDSCLRNEDIPGAEERIRRCSVALTLITRSIVARFAEAKAAETDVKDFTDHVAAHQESATIQLSQLIEEVRRKILASQKDSTRLREWCDKVDGENDRAKQVHADKLKEYSAALQRNNIETQKVWDELFKVLPKLTQLSDARKSLVDVHLADIDEERRRVAEYEHTLVVRAHHKDLLERLERDMTSANDLLRGVNAWTQQAFVTTNKKEFDVKLNRLKLDEAVRFYNAYRRYVVVDNERLFRKNQRLENNRRMVRNLQFLVKHASESLDDGISTYREQLKKATDTETELLADIQRISQTISGQKALWDGGMCGYLEFSDVEFDPPELIVQQSQLQLMSTLVESVDDAASKEQRALDQDKVSLRKLQNRCTATKADVESRRAQKAAVRQEAAAGGPGDASPVAATPAKASSPTTGHAPSSASATPSSTMKTPTAGR